MVLNNPIIRFATPSLNSASDFQNYFDKLTISTLTMKNITHYTPDVDTTLLLTMSDDIIGNSTISGLDIDSVDLLQGKSIFSIDIGADLLVEGASIKNININAYKYEEDGYIYLPNYGTVFTYYAVAETGYLEIFQYSFK
jgi:hypothetical protein